MTPVRRVAYAALAFAVVHIIFGAIVRITGSGMGCGDHWPRCQGTFFPSLDRPDLVIELTHRYLAAGLSVTILALVALTIGRSVSADAATGAHREDVRGPALLAAGIVLATALLGAVVVKLELTNKYVIVAHLALAMALVASLVATVLRAGGLGAASVAAGTASARTWRAARAAAVLALVAVVLGGLTAHLPGANSSCRGFPGCGRGMSPAGAGLYVQLAHRAIAFALLAHVVFAARAVRRRGEHVVVVRAATIGVALVALQIVVAAALVELPLPPVLRSLHQAIGTLVWLALFTWAALARRGASATGAPVPVITP